MLFLKSADIFVYTPYTKPLQEQSVDSPTHGLSITL